MTRSGNRQLNAALQRIALTQIRLAGSGQDYYRKKTRHRRLHPRSTTQPQTPPRPSGLQPPPHRPQQPKPAVANRQRLDIGETYGGFAQPVGAEPALLRPST